MRACVAAALAALLASGAAQAADTAPVCTAAFVDAAAASLRHKLAAHDLRDCRELPASPGHAAVALLHLSGGRAKAWELDFAILNSGGEIVHHLHRAAGNARTGEKLVGVKIDTGRFDLAAGVRAIGLRVLRKVPDEAGYSAGDVTTLELFVAEGSTLRSVLRDVEVASARGAGEALDCSDVRFEVSRTLDLGKGSTHGMRDLTLRRRWTGLSQDRQDEFCRYFDGKPRFKADVLRYDGSRYQAPDPGTE